MADAGDQLCVVALAAAVVTVVAASDIIRKRKRKPKRLMWTRPLFQSLHLNDNTKALSRTDVNYDKLFKLGYKVEQLTASSGSSFSAGQGAQLQDDQSSAINIAVEVHRTLSNAPKRKCNVAVSGLPEKSENLDNGMHDEQSFLTLCEEHFSFKSVLSHLGCRRLGKVPAQRQQQQPRKLLVQLTSEDSAEKPVG